MESLRGGWEAGIRTPISRVRVCCPTVERPPSKLKGLYRPALFIVKFWTLACLETRASFSDTLKSVTSRVVTQYHNMSRQKWQLKEWTHEERYKSGDARHVSD